MNKQIGKINKKVIELLELELEEELPIIYCYTPNICCKKSESRFYRVYKRI